MREIRPGLTQVSQQADTEFRSCTSSLCNERAPLKLLIQTRPLQVNHPKAQSAVDNRDQGPVYRPRFFCILRFLCL